MEQDNSEKKWDRELDAAEKELDTAKRKIEDKRARARHVSDALQHLKNAAPGLSDELEDKLDQQRHPPQALFEAARSITSRRRLSTDKKVKVVHYTSLETMHTLLTEHPTQYLRYYDSVHLTDPQEGWYVFEEKLGGRQQPVPDPASVREFLESTVSHAYIISFFPYENKDDEKTNDHLSHWRAYGDNGRGCSMTISVPEKELYRVNYCENERKYVACKLQRFVDVSDRIWKEIKTIDSDKKQMDILKICAEALKSRFLHKHPSYKHECERRALVANPDQSEIKTEVRGRHIRHYVTKPAFKMDCLLTSDCRITVGPAVDRKYDVKESFERILGNRGPKVDVSEIPYRTI